MGYLNGPLDGSNDDKLAGLLLGYLLGSNDGKVNGSNECKKLVIHVGKLLGTIIVNVYGITLRLSV